jgi:hypothetical protein
MPSVKKTGFEKNVCRFEEALSYSERNLTGRALLSALLGIKRDAEQGGLKGGTTQMRRDFVDKIGIRVQRVHDAMIYRRIAGMDPPMFLF